MKIQESKKQDANNSLESILSDFNAHASKTITKYQKHEIKAVYYPLNDINNQAFTFDLVLDVESHGDDHYDNFVAMLTKFAKTIMLMGTGKPNSIDIPAALIEQLSEDDIEDLLVATVNSPEQRFFVLSDAPQTMSEQFIDSNADEYVIYAYNSDCALMFSENNGFIVVPNATIANAHANKEDSFFVSKAVINDHVAKAQAAQIANAIARNDRTNNNRKNF